MTVPMDLLLTNRKRIRYALKPLLINTLSQGDVVLVPEANVLNGRLADPKGQSPLVYITSGNSDRPPLTVRQKQAIFRIELYSLVLLVDPNNREWTELMAEDLLDDIESMVKHVVESNPKAENLWTSAEYVEGGTTIERVPLAGHDYLVEMIPVIFKNSY